MWRRWSTSASRMSSSISVSPEASLVSPSLTIALLPSGHELVHTHPKLAISWYTVACYYWTTKKYESAQKYLMKATKIDKRSVSLSVSASLCLCLSLSLLTSLTSGGRFSNAWVLLGHVLAAQEESEHAISAYRTACRVLPGHHEPQVFMAKELVSPSDCPFPQRANRCLSSQTRTNNYSLSLHVLTEALELCPNDPTIMNELGVVYLHLNRLEEALGPFRRAAEGVLMGGGRKGTKRRNTSGALQVSQSVSEFTSSSH
jgi:anaphase-promoting complex subunit 6